MSPQQPGRAAIYSIAERFVKNCLQEDGSLFTEGSAIWTTAALDDLYERFAGHPDESADPFILKLSRQLAEAADSTIQLAAEVLLVHLLPASQIGGKKKREQISEVLGWMESPIVIPPDLVAALDTGIMHMGVAFNVGRYHGVKFLLEFARGWKQLRAEERAKFLADPWSFKEFVYDIPIFAAHSQREALLHLVHPEAFENIAKRQHKQDIVTAFSERAIGETDDVDRALLEIRKSLEAERGSPVNFYEDPIYQSWHKETVPHHPAPDTEGEALPVARRAWLIRGTTKAGDSLVPKWLDESFVSIGWLDAGPIEPGASRDEIRERIRAADPDAAPGRIGQGAGIVHKFLNEMRIGDLVIAPQRGDIYVGIVDSGPRWLDISLDEPPQLSRQRDVEWANQGAPVARTSLSAGLYSMMRTLLTLTDVTDYADEIALIAGIADEVKVPVTAAVTATLPAADDELAAATLLPSDWLQEVIELLERKRQIVFYGPPGTGKTFIAQRLGDHVVAAGGNYRLVQFHPSYTYEDFFEGFRPRTTDSETGVGFELVGGPLREIAEAALDDPSHPYLLIIDEINRANIAKVFGELYFLLEYRDAAVSLLYSPDREFQLPRNLYIIGTMNTADRSIALIDTAMRRRFYFFRFSPESEPIASVLIRWLGERSLDDEPARLLQALNLEINDPDFAIGPSYLMDPRISQAGELERVWTHALIPLLEEHFFGTGTDVAARFGLEALREQLGAALVDTQPESPESVDAVPDGE